MLALTIPLERRIPLGSLRGELRAVLEAGEFEERDQAKLDIFTASVAAALLGFALIEASARRNGQG